MRKGIDWAEIYATNFVDVPRCWDRYQCGSYCCRTSHDDFAFRFIRRNMVWLPLMPEEYRYLSSVGKLQDYDKGAIVRYATEFLPGKVAAVYMMRCKQGGMCLHCEFRPLICRVYPYFPVPTPDGCLETMDFSSIYDVARAMKDGHVACPIRAADDPVVRGCAEKAAKALFGHPHIVFYLRAAKAMMDVMRTEMAEKHSRILSLPVREFWAEWEMLFMTQRLFPREILMERFAAEYGAVSARFGEFETDRVQEATKP